MQLADESPVVLNGFGTVINGLGQRAKPYLPQVRGRGGIGGPSRFVLHAVKQPRPECN